MTAEPITRERQIIADWRKLIAGIESPAKWYTAEELSQRRAIPAEDGAFIAAVNPTAVSDFLDLITAALDSERSRKEGEE